MAQTGKYCLDPYVLIPAEAILVPCNSRGELRIRGISKCKISAFGQDPLVVPLLIQVWEVQVEGSNWAVLLPRGGLWACRATGRERGMPGEGLETIFIHFRTFA